MGNVAVESSWTLEFRRLARLSRRSVVSLGMEHPRIYIPARSGILRYINFYRILYELGTDTGCSR